MNALTHWNPFRSGSRFDLGTDFDDMLRGFSLRPWMRDFEAAATDMRLDVLEDDEGYRVTADLPGVKKKDIQISVEGNQVTIEGEIKREESKKERKQLHTERYYGKIYRSFTLPLRVDSDKCSASYDDGVLTLKLPKKANGSSRRIDVQ
jgi:HSP20 family protein